MGTTCSKSSSATVKGDDTYSPVNPEKGKSSIDGLSVEVARMLNAQIPNDSDAEEKELDDNRLSDLAEMLFLQQQKFDATPAVEMGNEKPIELESEQTRRRLMKRQASIAGASRFTTHRGSIVVLSSDSEFHEPSFTKMHSLKKPHSSLPFTMEPKEPEIIEKKATVESAVQHEPQNVTPIRDTAFEPDQTYITPALNFQRLFVSGENGDFLLEELRNVAVSLIHALETRQYYMRLSRQIFPLKVTKALARARGKPAKTPVYPIFIDPMQRPPSEIDEKTWSVSISEGTMTIIDIETKQEVPLPQVDRDRFLTRRNLLYALVADGPLKSFCYRRLSFLKNKFGLHCLLNETVESEIMKSPDRKCRRDFYNVRKVDTHIHAAACMSQKHLLGFIQDKAKTEPDRVVLRKGGKKMTLKEVFKSLDLDPFFLNVDALDVHADRQTFQRFDRFNNLYSPMGASELREIFLKTSNDINGDYFAEIIKEVEKSMVDQKYHLLELRISIYGKNYKEWYELAKWFTSHKLESTHIRWLIQVPRLYDVYKSKGAVKNYQQILDNLFRPVFEATIHPNKHKDVHLFLRHVTGFDSVDDESKPEPGFLKKSSPTPDKWDRENNPSYSYYIYYMYTNIVRLNHLRHMRGMNTFVLRPHCGEAGSYDHLLTGFMLSHNISHGLVLKTVPVLQYLYYLAQIPICMSPLSNNHLFLEYNKNPFPEFFARGLKVCLSTDDPLQFHFTMEPLMEEYAVAAQVWKFSVCDMCEMARTSVQASCFSHTEKKHWLGDYYRKEGAAGNDISRTNVPNVRVAFREETLLEELHLLTEAYTHKNKLKGTEEGSKTDELQKQVEFEDSAEFVFSENNNKTFVK